MPRGRHRHSPPLHRLLPPSAIAGVSLVCAVGPWLFTEPAVLRVLAAGAAVTAVAGAVVMRRWDTAAGKRVADLTRARASDEWRHDERVAELETDLDESRELRVKLEHKLRAKRTELAGLRNEHAALLRRYATAETERATALEGRRQLAIEASVPTRALPAARTAPDETAVPEPVDPAGFFGVAEAPDAEDERERSAEAGAAPQADGADPATGTRDDTKDTTDTKDSTTPEDAEDGGTAAGDDAPSEDTGTAGSSVDTDTDTDTDADAAAGATADADTTGEVFSPAGSGLFLRAGAALNRISSGGPQKESAETAAPGAVAVAEPDSDTDPDADPDPDAAPDTDADAEGGADPAQAITSQGAEPGESALDAAVKDAAARKSAAARQRTTGPKAGTTNTEPPKGASRGGAATPSDAGPSAGPDPSSGAGAEDGGAQGKPEAVGGHQRAAAEAKPSPSRPAPRATPSGSAAPAVPDAVPAPAARQHHPVKAAEPAKRSGHFTVPTAVAVVPPTAPVRRPSVEGGFDFFGTQKEASDAAAMEAVQNEDLADVVGQEALALHKAEAESGFKTASEGSLGAGQVIDLTAHDETEQIDVAGLRSAAS
ncbi:hypothetical protein AB0454_04780 [Streptomyces sp. NPDC093509]|uniref:hypothetical protein n=1 Tax=Streptomyces sp. NPDC093509 TaxID=3154982 RepID=UPI00344DDC2E